VLLMCATRRLVASPSSGDELEGRFLGLMAYLEPKGKGESRMPGNRRPGPGVRDGASGDPRELRVTAAIGEHDAHRRILRRSTRTGAGG
jgi:hypothetical protein